MKNKHNKKSETVTKLPVTVKSFSVTIIPTLHQLRPNILFYNSSNQINSSEYVILYVRLSEFKRKVQSIQNTLN